MSGFWMTSTLYSPTRTLTLRSSIKNKKIFSFRIANQSYSHPHEPVSQCAREVEHRCALAVRGKLFPSARRRMNENWRCAIDEFPGNRMLPFTSKAVMCSAGFIRVRIVCVCHRVSGSRDVDGSCGEAADLGRSCGDQFPVLFLCIGRAKTRP